MNKRLFSNKELYQEVWSQTLLTLAKKYAISDVGLRKTCVRLNIPLTKAGHGQKLKFGKKVRRAPLPQGYAGTASVSLGLRDTTATLTAKGESPLTVLKRQIEAEIPRYLTVPEKLTAPHPLVLSAWSSVSTSKVDTYLFKGTVSCSSGELDIRVNRESIARALRFLDTLIKALEVIGHTIDIRSRATCLTVEGIDYDLRLREKMRKEKEKQAIGTAPFIIPLGYWPASWITVHQVNGKTARRRLKQKSHKSLRKWNSRQKNERRNSCNGKFKRNNGKKKNGCKESLNSARKRS